LEELKKPDDARAEYDLYLKEAPTGLNAVRAYAGFSCCT